MSPPKPRRARLTKIDGESLADDIEKFFGPGLAALSEKHNGRIGIFLIAFDADGDGSAIVQLGNEAPTSYITPLAEVLADLIADRNARIDALPKS